MQRMYSRHGAIYDATRWMTLLGRRRVIEEFALNPGDRILEVGCGTGRNLPPLCRKVGPRGEVVGLDCAPAMLQRARKRMRGHANVDLVEGEYGMPGVVEGPFDAIVFSYSLSMIANFEHVLERALRDLRPGGRIAVVDFLDSCLAPVHRLIESYPVTLGPARRKTLRRLFTEGSDASRRGFLGLWRYYSWIGSRGEAKKAADQ